jgi:hypothetical protein
MADKSKSKTARGKSKSTKAADAAASASKATPSKAAAGKTSTAKTAAKAGKKGKPKAAKAAIKQPKSATPPAAEQLGGDTLVDTFYVCTGLVPIEIRDTPPAGGSQFVEFASFDAARDHFLEQLIEAIEQYERMLHAVRRAESFADYLDQPS